MVVQNDRKKVAHVDPEGKTNLVPKVLMYVEPMC